MRKSPHVCYWFLTTLFFLYSIQLQAQTQVPPGAVSGVWSLAGSPYIINGNITIGQDQKLTIEPGVQLLFSGSYGLLVSGSLEAVGTQQDSIRFTVVDKTGYANNTHVGWKGITFQNVQHADSSRLLYTVIEYGKLEGSGDGFQGGAVSAHSFSKLDLRHSALRYNRAYNGGAIYLNYVTGISLKNLSITRNYASYTGGAVSALNSTFELDNSFIARNTAASYGGAFYFMQSNVTLARCTVTRNNSYMGGVMKAYYQNIVKIENSTLAGNTGSPDGFDMYYSDLICSNSILWNKSDNNTFAEISSYSTGKVILSNCIVKGQLAAEWKKDNVSTSDPKFVNLTNGDVRPSWTNYPAKDLTRSPAIDAGNPETSHDPDGTISDIGSLPYPQTSQAFPTAMFTSDTTVGVRPLTIQFTSYSTQALGTIASFEWNFGDGQTSTEENPTHSYASNGLFSVKLRVINQDGKKDSLTRPNYIRALAGTIVNTATISGTWTKENSPYNIYNDVTIPSGQSLLIEPGVEVHFTGRYRFNVNGTLTARGTRTDSIIFKSFDPAVFSHSIRIENVTTANQNDSIIFDYCRIQNARYISGELVAGGNAVYVKDFHRVRISNSTLRNNFAASGGGIYAYNANIKIINNHIHRNSVDVVGGGIVIFQCSPILTGNVIERNYAGSSGGGIYMEGSQSFIANNQIRNNSCYWNGGGIVLNNSNATLIRNVIAYNESGHDDGGGMAIYASSPKVMNNTISFNRAEEGEGIYINGISKPEFINTIIYSNRDRYQNYNNADEIYLDSDDADPNFYNCNIQGGIARGMVLRYGVYKGANINTINVKPLFADSVAGNLAITWQDYPVVNETKSLLIDAGKIDSPHDPDGSVSDIGAYFFLQHQNVFEPRVDLQADTVLGFNQLAVQFKDTSDPGTKPITEWHWEFGDGSVSNQQHPLHTYLAAGEFNVKLTIKDAHGFSRELVRQKYIKVLKGTYISGNVEGVFSDSVYFVGGDITLANGYPMQIDAGTSFVFMGQYTFNAYGSLKALGTASEPIRMTAYDTAGLYLEKNVPANAGWKGIYIYKNGAADSTILDHCKIEFVDNNRGAVHAFTNSAGIRISNSEISYNSSQGIMTYSKVVIRNNYIHHNYASYGGNGGGICVVAGTPLIMSNIICSNRSEGDGGGIAIYDDGQPQITNNAICHNHSSRGGGISDYSGNHSPLNNTIVYNSATSGAAGYFIIYAGYVQFTNTIIARNLGTQIEISDPYTYVGFRNCILEGGRESISGYKSVYTYENVSIADPLIAQSINFHGRLLKNSPAIDAGTLVDIPSALPVKDVMGFSRIQNNQIDIGANEFTTTQAIAFKKRFNDVVSSEDFDAVTIMMDEHFSYPAGNAWLEYGISNANEITLLSASLKNRQLSFSSLKDRFGDQRVIVFATDGVADPVYDTLFVRIAAVNDPPNFTISGDLALNEDFTTTNYPIALSIPFGEQNESYAYSLTPQPDFVSTSFSGGNLVIAPKLNASGDQWLTLTINDGKANYSRTFHLIVNPVNDAPQIILNRDDLVLEVSQIRKLDVQVSDADNDATSLIVTVDNPVVKLNVLALADNKFSVEIEGLQLGKAKLTARATDTKLQTLVDVNVTVALVTSTADDAMQLAVYPNPVQDVIVVDGNKLADTRIKLQSASGKVVLETNLVDGTNYIEIKNLSKGIYILNFQKSGSLYTYRIVKE